MGSLIRLSEVSTFRMSSFTNLIETTVENSSDYLQQFSEQTQPARLAQRLFELLESVKGIEPKNPVDLFEHGVQSATRAFRDGEDTETVVCALFHDVGELLSPACHGEIAASILRPFISEKNYWILQHHEIFQTYYYGKAWNVDPDLREEFSSSPYYEDCIKFCQEYDQTAFDPQYENMSPAEFYPMVLEVFSRPAYSVLDNLDSISSTKKKICY